MTDQKVLEPANDFPPGLAKPALRALSAAGYTRLDQLTVITEADLLKYHGMGPKGISILRDALQARGKAFDEPGSQTQTTSSQEQIFDSIVGNVRSHIREYVESDGRKGHYWRGLPTLLLITRGRKTGKLRRTALIYGQDGNNYLVVASFGGNRRHPAWYLNLVENPEVDLQVGSDKFVAHARVATPEEKPRLWQVMAEIFPTYNQYQVKALKNGRDIPVVILEPA